MILGAGPLQVPAIKKAKELGLKVVVCDYDDKAIGIQYADTFLPISTIDEEAVLEAAKVEKPDYIFTSTSDAPVRTAAYVCEKLGLPTDIKYEDAVCATLKSAMRDRLQRYHVPIPNYFSCTNYEEFERAVKNIDGECVIKPADNAASRGVELFHTKASKDEYQRQYAYSKNFSRNGIVMVEELMHGPEVSVECLIINSVVHIIAITDKLVTPLPFFVELGHSKQSQLPESTKKKIRKVTMDAIHAIRIVNGCSHVEMKVTEEGPKIVELAARLGGDYITSKLVPLSTGIDMVGDSILLALHRPVEIKRTRNCGSAIRFFAGEEGVIKDIIIHGNPKDVSGFKEMKIECSVGDRVHTLHSSNDRLGYVITEGKNAAQAIERVEEIMKMIEFVIRGGYNPQLISSVCSLSGLKDNYAEAA